jgi:hypothetical protein
MVQNSWEETSLYINYETELVVLEATKIDIFKVWIIPNSGLIGIKIIDKEWKRK